MWSRQDAKKIEFGIVGVKLDRWFSRVVHRGDICAEVVLKNRKCTCLYLFRVFEFAFWFVDNEVACTIQLANDVSIASVAHANYSAMCIFHENDVITTGRRKCSAKLRGNEKSEHHSFSAPR
jgi:hypothetical protein